MYSNYPQPAPQRPALHPAVLVCCVLLSICAVLYICGTFYAGYQTARLQSEIENAKAQVQARQDQQAQERANDLRDTQRTENEIRRIQEQTGTYSTESHYNDPLPRNPNVGR